MGKTYKSKIGQVYIWATVILTCAFIGSVYLCFISTPILLINVVMCAVGLCLIFDMLAHTDYTIRGDKLYIRCGILFSMTLPVDRITEITRKSTILSSPALSMDRIGLRYGPKKWVYVSPQNRDAFIADLTALNPSLTLS